MSSESVFLDEYESLVRKHGVKISGCGCCGSPFTSVIDADSGWPGQSVSDHIAAHFRHLRGESDYGFDHGPDPSDAAMEAEGD